MPEYKGSAKRFKALVKQAEGKRVLWKPHGSYYQLYVGTFAGKPWWEFRGIVLMKDGTVDMEGGLPNLWMVEEAPTHYKKAHRTVLQKLGLTSREAKRLIKAQVDYYKEKERARS